VFVRVISITKTLAYYTIEFINVCRKFYNTGSSALDYKALSIPIFLLYRFHSKLVCLLYLLKVTGISKNTSLLLNLSFFTFIMLCFITQAPGAYTIKLFTASIDSIMY
jgi:hypothetical protein